VYSDELDKRSNPFGQRYCWRICKELSHTPCEGGDIDAVEAGYVAVTPIKLDATDYAAAHAIAKLLGYPEDGLANA
jgi:5'-nucleotidase